MDSGALAYRPMFVTRFAPSPTGLLHLGHAFSALTAFDAARKAKGRFILRIEDTDITRCRPEFEAAIYEDLAWLGLHWEEPVRRQSEHMDDYASALNRLIELGVMYRCFKTRKALLADIANAPHKAQVAYHGAPLSRDDESLRIEGGEPYAWRLSMDKCAKLLGDKWSKLQCETDGIMTILDPGRLGDVVIARKEFPASYHLASVCDDAAQGVSHVIRGEDLIEAPHLHVLLQKLLELPTPKYIHHHLILDDEGTRLAKRNQSVTLRAMREVGDTPQEIRARLGLAQ
jgi:glutamyl-Q tRNA(Asp) synthetase